MGDDHPEQSQLRWVSPGHQACTWESRCMVRPGSYDTHYTHPTRETMGLIKTRAGPHLGPAPRCGWGSQGPGTGGRGSAPTFPQSCEMAGIPPQACALGSPAATEKGGAGRGGRLPPPPGSCGGSRGWGWTGRGCGHFQAGDPRLRGSRQAGGGAEQTGDTGPQVSGREREEEPNAAR